jgi:hypothetical protein
MTGKNDVDSLIWQTALRELRDRGRTDIYCARCYLIIGSVGIGRKPWATTTYAHDDNHYAAGERIPLWCAECQRRYDGHTPDSLLRRVRSGRCDDLIVPY